MADQVIVCPHCKKKIALTEAITQKIQEDLRKAFAQFFSEFDLRQATFLLRRSLGFLKKMSHVSG